MNEIKAAIFDMDGTILNTLVDLKDATNYGLSKNNLPERSLEEIRQFVGNGIKSLIAKAVPENTSAEIYQKVYEDFTKFYKIHNSDNTCPYKGIKDAIKKIRESGIKTAVVSTGHHPERFPKNKNKDMSKNDLLYKYYSTLSHFMKLGDTFEVYCRKTGK